MIILCNVEVTYSGDLPLPLALAHHDPDLYAR